MAISEDYQGREQSWIKHRVLRLYLESWAHKLASTARDRDRVKLWYVDCFAGPWESNSKTLDDTSIAIGLDSLQSAAKIWKGLGYQIELGAIFVEKDPKSFSLLQEYLARRNDSFQVIALQGEFSSQVSAIERLIKDDPAFVFVDPTGWTGAEMEHIKPLVARPRRDVLVNVMYDYMNRFMGHPEAALREQISRFFQCEVPADLSERDLISLYRSQLKKVCGLGFAADLIVQYPLQERTYFRLVVGGRHERVLSLFRDVEKKVVGTEAPLVRAEAKELDRLNRTDQYSIFSATEILQGGHIYEVLNQQAIADVRQVLPSNLGIHGPRTFEAIRQHVLQEFHMTESDLKKLLWDMRREGIIEIEGIEKNQRSVKDGNLIRKGTKTALRESIQESLFGASP